MDIKNLKLVGALTSKPYAFKARSWELKNIETIDLFDSLCSNIRMDIKGSDIMRILPVQNDYINEEWISDKTRFTYDSLKRWRFTNPMIFKQNLYLQVSWKEAISFINENFLKNKFDNIIINTGDFISVEHLVVLKDFAIKKNNIILNSNLKVNFDIQNYFISHKNIFNLKGQKIFLLLGLNLRIENPILNIKFYKLSKLKTVLIGYIGSKYNYNIEGYHLGCNLSILKKILEYKHFFSTLSKIFLKSLKIKNKFKNKTLILCGKQLLNITNFNKLENLLLQKDTNYDLKILSESSGKINALELGFFSNKQFNIVKNSKNLIYLLNSEFLKKNSNDFVIFQGHHNSLLRHKIDVILPSLTWAEQSNLYFNCLGILQKTRFAVTPPINSKDDWKITSIIFNNFNKYTNIAKIHKRLNELTPNAFYSISKKQDNKELNFSLKSLKQFNIFVNWQNTTFKSFNSNKSLLTSLERASKTMINSFKIKNNFFK